MSVFSCKILMAFVTSATPFSFGFHFYFHTTTRPLVLLQLQLACFSYFYEENMTIHLSIYLFGIPLKKSKVLHVEIRNDVLSFPFTVTCSTSTEEKTECWLKMGESTSGNHSLVNFCRKCSTARTNNMIWW